MAPQTRGIPEPADVERIIAALRLQAEVQHQLEAAVADALKAGGSVREVAAATRLSTTTVQKYGRAHSWPTSKQRASWEADRIRHDDWTARLNTASAMLAHLGEDVEGDATPNTPDP